MPYEDAEAIITTGPIVATYGDFRVRPFLLTIEGGQPRQLPFYLILVELPPHPETAFAETRTFDASEEMVVRAVVAVLRLEYRTLTGVNLPVPRSAVPRVATGTGPEADAIRANRQVDSDRFQWAARALGGVADVVYHFGEGKGDEDASEEGIKGKYMPGVMTSDGSGMLEVVPREEETLVATFGPFQVWRKVDARTYLSHFPLAEWSEPWRTKIWSSLHLSYEANGRKMPMPMAGLEKHENPVTRADVIAAVRGWIDFARARMAGELARIEATQDTERMPSPDKLRRAAEVLAEFTAAVEALETEESA